MNLLLTVVLLVLLLIGVQVAVAYICNRLNIGVKTYTFNDLLNDISGFIGRVGGAYYDYVKQSKAKALAQARFIAMRNYLSEYLTLFKFLLLEAMRATAAINGLVVPLDSDRLLIGNPIRVNKYGFHFLQFSCWDNPSYSIPTKQIQAYLNVEFKRLCELNNLPQVWVTSVRRVDRRVYFNLALATDIRASKQAAQQAAQKAGGKNGIV